MSYMKLFSLCGISYLSLVSWTSNNWLMIWYFMEISLVLFMSLMTLGKSYSVVEVMIKYYIIQVFFSLLFLIFMIFVLFNLSIASSWFILLFMMIKMGLFPFHFWLISIMGKLDWVSFLTMSTLLKLIPLLMVYFIVSVVSFYLILFSSLIFGSLGGINNMSLQKMMGYSSMVNLCWILYSLGVSFLTFWLYLGGYFCMMLWFCMLMNYVNVFYINQFKLMNSYLSVKMVLFLVMLSIVGFPPFLGFMIKWLVITNLWFMNMKLLIFMMIFFSVFSIYFYLQIFFMVMMIYSNWCKWYSLELSNLSGLSILLLMSYLSGFLIY
uniref:NADH-ubiquinone oxidoreductase chain 2 n=1 Tax=Bemisia afer TaxID=166114 RepID=A0A0U2GVR7_BEMAF|nr:NADH dehydrogenase subunit 2 [Bemisia afer]